jgi:hypothetical protein
MFGKKNKEVLDSSIHSAGSLRGRNNSVSKPSSMSMSMSGGGDLFKEWKLSGVKNNSRQ